MGEAYKAFTEAVEGHRARISELNAEINKNRAQHAAALAAYDKATLAGEATKAQQHRETAERLDASLKWLQRDLETISGNGGPRNNPIVMDAASKVHTENRQLMAKLQDSWEQVASQLNGHKAALLACICELGKIEKQALSLRAQLNDITDTTGMQPGTWLSTPGARLVNIEKSTGLIFLDPKEAAERFKWPDKFSDKEQKNGVI